MSKPDLPVEYMRSLVSTANEVLDFYVHDVALFNRNNNEFSHSWHFITGYSRRRRNKSSLKREVVLRKILFEGQTRIGLPRIFEDCERIGTDTLLVPLYIDNLPVGILAFSPPKSNEFTEYDAYIATCVAKIVATGFSKETKRNMLAPLQYCMLHRRHFLAAMPMLDEVLEEYLGRAIKQHYFPILSRHAEPFGNIRIVEMQDTLDDPLKVCFAEIIGKVGTAGRSRARKHELNLSMSKMRNWIGKWAKFNRKIPRDIDPRYMEIFPSARSHVAVPCWYGGRLCGILSVDSPHRLQFDSMTVRAMCILAAQAAPVIANAQNRQELRKKHNYLESVINAIPDELSIVDDKARIVMMNKAKQQNFKNARKGDFCFKCFEYGKKAVCRGCYTMLARKTGISVQQALWQYKHPKTKKINYVEISAGQINLCKGMEPQAVEIVRNVTAREALITWMMDIQMHLLYALQKMPAEKEDDPEQLTEWLWKHFARGLKVMGFPRYRVYSFSSDVFSGRICFPHDTFRGDNFSQFRLSAKLDIPSRVLLRDAQMRPILFIVDGKRKKDWYIPRKAIEWNYLTCYLRKIPKECSRKFEGRKLRSWVEILIGVPSQIFGKISVDKGSSNGAQDVQYETAHEMALLATFGRFASVVMQMARHHALGVQTEREAWREFSALAAHRIGNEISSVGMLLDTLRSQIMSGSELKKDWEDELPIMQDCIKNAKHMLIQQTLLTGEIKPKPVSIKLGWLVKRAITGVIPNTGKLKMKDSTGQLRIAVDKKLMEQAFRELATNAVKAIGEGIIVLKISADIKDDEAVIHVCDNGPGIQRANIERIFEPYVSFRDPCGGLGLTIVRRIVQAHGGSINVGRSKDGAKFIIRIPLKGNNK